MRQTEPNEQLKSEKRQRRDSLKEWAVVLLVALVVALVLTQVIFVNAVVPSESMENTIKIGDRLLGFRLSYWNSSPKRGDIVIFRYPDNEEELYVKRVVGLPGEEVEIRGGDVYINGVLLPEANQYIKEQPRGDYGPWTVPETAYFVMGDNRNQSWDSRFWTNKFVYEDKILGKVVFRILPVPGKVE